MVVIDHSTISPTVTEALAASSADEGAVLLDAQISGGEERAINPVANRVVSRFFQNVEDQLSEVAESEDSSGSLRKRVTDLV